MIDNDFLYLSKSVLVERQNRVADQLVLFECTNYFTIVAGRQMTLLANLRSDGLHLSLDLAESLLI
jgi:hypothetical protein